MARNVAVILASGVGDRSGFARPKQLAKLGGRPLIAHVLERFQAHPDIDEIAVVTNALCITEIEALLGRERLPKVKRVLLGGKERSDSSVSAIRAYEEEAARDEVRLIFHDAVRPLVSQQIISDVIAALDHYGAVDVAVSASDTVIVVDKQTNTIREIPDRSTIRLGQTPQGFHWNVIDQAYRRAAADPGFRTTDDCGVVLRYTPEHRVFVVNGAISNLKLTYADDLLVIDKFLQSGAGKRLDAPVEHLGLTKLRDRVLIVFGGTSGIGQGMVSLAQAYGAKVVAVGRGTGVDIADAAQVSAEIDRVLAEHGRIDAVVNAAAVLNRQPLASMAPAEIAESVNTNILGALNVARAAYDALHESRGHLMLFASSSYTYGRALYSTYSASKAAVVNLTQALADEWADAGIKVNCINPERTSTPMRTRAFGQEPADTLLDPEDVARRALGVLVGETSGLIYDIAKTQLSRTG